jgi:large subunit ribosomal protein L9
LRKQGFDVAKGLIRMPQGPLKAVGEHHVAVALHTDVAADITVAVVAEQS